MKSFQAPLKFSRWLAVCSTALFVATCTFNTSAAAGGPPRLSTIQGITKIQNQDVVVTVIYAVPAGEDARANGRRALQSIQPGAREIDSSTFVLTGSVWDQFGDGVAGNDFVEVNYNGENTPSYLNPAEAAKVFVDSMATWTAVPSSSFVFQVGEETTRCPSLVNECKGSQYFDGLNDVTWLNIRERNVLGVTWSGTSIDEFDMAIDNQDFTWYVGNGPVPNNAIDLQTVVTHEFGHAAGIGHSEVNGAVMEPYYEGERRKLAQDDIDALTFLYPSGNGGGTDPGTDPNPDPDNTAPTISKLAAAKLHPKNGRFEITWTTDEPADSFIRFTSPVTDAFTESAYVTQHGMAFRGTPGVFYEFQVMSTDAAGNSSAIVSGTHQN